MASHILADLSVAVKREHVERKGDFSGVLDEMLPQCWIITVIINK